MKKELSFILVVMISLFCKVDAQGLVTEAETKTAAVHYAQTFLQHKSLSSSNILTVYSYEDNSVTLMREVVFDNGLSVLMSACKICLPVLLYSTNHTTILSDIDNIPDGLRDYIHNYAGAIAYAANESRNLNVHPDWALLLDTESSESKSQSGHIYGPFLTTKWGQKTDNYCSVCNAYNYYVTQTDDDCPCDTCATGCVATAMAQIMKYWNYPVYRPNRIEQYDWCNMPDELFNWKYNETGTQQDTNFNYEMERNAIARLMADCGKAADMDYCFHECESFTFPVKARNALVDSFGYHSDAVRLLRSGYTTNQWKNMLITDIRNGRPVLYAGMSWKSINYEFGGHAFVCDGYNENTDKFHFNWGHRGEYNEVWCTIDSIIEGNHNWNHLERAVFNIHPAGIQDYCDFEVPLWGYYNYYYNVYGNSTPDPHEIVPKTFTRLTSVPNEAPFPSTWRTIPSGATSEYVAHEEILLQDGFLAENGSDFYAHIVPCPSCEGREIVNVDTLDESNADTLAAPKLLQTETSSTDNTALRIYPNPTDDVLYVELSGAGIRSVGLYDLQGRVVADVANAGGYPTVTLNVRSVPAGIYLLRVTDTEGRSYARKVTIR